MAEIRLEGIAHSYDGGETWALRPITMTWEDGKAYAVLGPSGCGKTTLLNIMSGLVQPSLGRILIDGVDVTGVPTVDRNIAQVFQFPVLYDTMTVRQNLAFPLRNRGYAKAAVADRVGRIATLLGLADDLDTKPHRLRADLQQIVSLGRGLVREDVAAILFDEPLTVIDPTHKWELRSKLKELHRDIGHTLVYVTHDQTEALTFADEVVVLNEGAVVQSGRPSELFESPTHEFVGHFIGSPGMNFIDATIEGDRVLVGGEVAGVVDATGDPLPPGPVRIGVRPEYVAVKDAPASPGLGAAVTMTEQRGAFTLVHADVDGSTVIAKMPPYLEIDNGAAIHLRFQAERTVLLRDGVVCGRMAAPRVEVGA